VDVNTKDDAGNTALHLACIGGRANLVRELLKHRNVDVNAKDKHGFTALMVSCLSYEINIVKFRDDM
jgi:ankyrin repeat protein